MRYLFLTVFLAFLLAMGLPSMVTAVETQPDDSAQAATSPHADVDFETNEIHVSPVPDAAAAGLQDNPSDVISFDAGAPNDPTDNVLTISPHGDIGGPETPGNPGFGQNNHPGRP